MLRSALLPVIDLVYPPRCPACGEALAAQDGLCGTCWAALERPEGACCADCSRPLATSPIADDHWAVGSICAACMAEPPQHDGIAAATLYCPIARKLVLSFKYGRRLGLCSLMARMMASAMPQLEGEWLVVPVPLHWSRIWRRGYNQSALLARAIAQHKGQALSIDALVRRKRTRPLGGLGKAARSQTLRGAIAINKRASERISGRNILLVDDVLTSGATTNACVSTLKRSGANKVVIVCFARVIN